MSTIFNFRQNTLKLECSDTNHHDQITLDETQLRQMTALLKAYQDRPKHDPEQSYLKKLGEDLYQWLNRRLWLDQLLEEFLPTPWQVEFCVPTRQPNEDEAHFLHLPWELLAKDGRFLAGELSIQYSPLRRLGKAKQAPTPTPNKPALMFMAASPEGSTILDYEQEESIILEATGGLYQHELDVFVEESGNLQQLSRELLHLNGVDILHLSCHGTQAQTLVLEKETGEADFVNAQQLYRKLNHHQPRLLFLSACHSAEQANGSGLSMGLVQAGYANVLGWADAVKDHDASRFASILYGEISKGSPLEQALAQCRFQALNPDAQQTIISDWHLARLYCSPQGGGVLANGRNSRNDYQAMLGEKQFLGAKAQAGLQVAGRDEFVGRRRPMQQVLSAWRNGKGAVLIHGMGRQGKSSLAARLANRMQHLRLVVIYGQYDAVSIAREIRDQAQNSEIEQHLTEDKLRQLRDDPTKLTLILRPILAHNILLVVDDLEQILTEQAQHRHQIADQALQRSMIALIKLFHDASTPSRLLFTSRFPFDLFSFDKNWGDVPYVQHEPLPAMTPQESQKQYRQQQRKHALALAYAQQQQLLALASGSPGLQALLFTVLHETEQAERQTLLDEFAAHKQQGAALSNQTLQDTLQHIAVDKLLQLASQQQRDGLQAMQLIITPIPQACLKQIGLTESDAQRLIDLGLLDVFPTTHADSQPQVLTNPLVYPHALPALESDSQNLLVQHLLPCLQEYWQSPDQLQAWQLVKLAQCNKNVAVLQTHAEQALNYLWDRQEYTVGLLLAKQLFALAEQLELNAWAWMRIAEFLQVAEDQGKAASQCYELALQQQQELDEYIRLGVMLSQVGLFVQQGEIEKSFDQLKVCEMGFADIGYLREVAIVKGQTARIKVNQGDVEAALTLYYEMLGVFEHFGDQRSRALALGSIARILVDRGEVEAALTLHHEAMTVYERLGAQRERALALGDIARTLFDRGEAEEALTLHREALNIYECLGAQRDRAMTLGDIARILVDRGEFEAALTLHHERKSVFERLGDQRERAVTLSDIARILVERGEFEAALTLHHEAMTVYERLGAQRERALALGGIARIFNNQGDIEAALNLYQEALVVLERLGDQRSKALILGDIARILNNQGDIEAALNLYHKILGVFESFGDQRSRAVTLGDIARILNNQGDVGEALTLHHEKLNVCERLGDQRERALALGDIARILNNQGDVKEALTLHHEKLSVFERLGDQRELAVTLGDIARIKVNQGEVEAALNLYHKMLGVFECLGDQRLRAVTLDDLGQLMLQQQNHQQALSHFTKAYQFFMQQGDLFGVTFVGVRLGQLLCAFGKKELGQVILQRSLEGYLKLGREERAKMVREMLQRCEQSSA
jgi:tetratricopeptide (TPR) repeat protein